MPEDSGSFQGIFATHVSRKGETAMLALKGEFDLAAVELVRAKLDEAYSGEPSRVVIDLSELTFIDSTGISFLLSAVKADEEGRLSFIPCSALGVQRVLAITGVAGVFGGVGEAESLSRA